MPELKRSAAIVGIGELAPSGDSGGANAGELALRVVREAIADARLQVTDIDGIITAGMGSGGPLGLAQQLGLQPGFTDTCEIMGASGAGMVWRAAAAIAEGAATAVVCTTAGAAGRGGAARPATARAPAPAAPPPRPRPAPFAGPAEFEAPFGPMGVNSGYAMIAQRHAYEFGTTDRQRAKIAVDQRTNATLNPMARYRDPITIDDVLESRLVVDPLHLLEIVRPCVGAAAYVLAKPDRVRESAHVPVWLLGSGEKIDPGLVDRAPNLTTTAIAYTAPAAFEMAGLKPSDMDLLSLYDCYTIMVLMTLEDAGFCAKGRGGPFVEEHDLSYRGDVPVNTHGGQLSFGQPGLAGGASHITEAVRQLRGDGGERQVRDCELALVNGNGGVMSEECSLVLGR